MGNTSEMITERPAGEVIKMLVVTDDYKPGVVNMVAKGCVHVAGPDVFDRDLVAVVADTSGKWFYSPHNLLWAFVDKYVRVYKHGTAYIVVEDSDRPAVIPGIRYINGVIHSYNIFRRTFAEGATEEANTNECRIR